MDGLLAEKKGGEGGHPRHEGHEHAADGDAGREEEQLEPLVPDPLLEHGAGDEAGQAAAQGQQAPDEADLLTANAHTEGQVRLAGPEDAHGQALAPGMATGSLNLNYP